MGWLGNVVKMHPPAIMTTNQIDEALHLMDQSLTALKA
jgi:4-aminobutyrate aminotransferase-like enzyme